MRVNQITGSVCIPYTEELVLVVLKDLFAMQEPFSLLCYHFRDSRALGLEVVNHIARLVNGTIVFENRKSYPSSGRIKTAIGRYGGFVVIDLDYIGLQLDIPVLDFCAAVKSNDLWTKGGVYGIVRRVKNGGFNVAFACPSQGVLLKGIIFDCQGIRRRNGRVADNGNLSLRRSYWTLDLPECIN